MEKWVVTSKRADFKSLAKRFGIDPVTARLIRNRDVKGEEEMEKYLHGSLKDLPSPHRLKDVDRAVQILKEKIASGKRIRIIGDYDIDGVTSTCILLKGMTRLGACVDTYIPDRVLDGYGIHMPLIEKAVEDQVDTIVTCDNGIAAVDEIASAKALGLTVIVTDHHEVPYEEKEGVRTYRIPPADAVVNTKQEDCTYPYKNICGAVVAWKLICALYEAFALGEQEQYEFLELAAIATVGDVMDLQGENRILVKEGLRRLGRTKNPGLRALMRVNGLENEVSAYHVGFVLGPCINASGRLDTASRSLKLLMSDRDEEAAELAGDLKALNESRKALTEEGRAAAERQVEETSIKEDRVLVIYLPQCHESLAGIIAGRIREAYNKPVFVLTRGEHGVKGSGRSIEAYSMYEELTKCADLLLQFGGHPMAAGLSLTEENVEPFRRRLNEQCTLTEEDLLRKVVIDVPMPISYVSRRVVEELSLLEPFGKGNTKPLFAQKGIRVISGRILGKNQNVARVQLADSSGYVLEGIYFGEAAEFLAFAQGQQEISVTYYPEINTYQGRETLQLVIKNYC
jgi:single-stranded-DNA-specific exonuclease